MDESLQNWLSFLETNEYHLCSEFDTNPLEEELEGENSVDPAELSWKNHSSCSYLTTESTTLLGNNKGNSLFLEENSGLDRITSLKQHASSPQKPKSCILSFEDSTSVPNAPKKITCQYRGEDSKKTQEKPHSGKKGRTSSQTQDHIMAERKRRETITRMFIALSALIPGLKKMDKASVLNSTLEYIKFLQQRVKELEQENKKRKIESVACFKINKTNNVADDVSWTYDGLDDRPMKKICPKVEARVSGKDVLIRVICEKQKNIVRKLLAKLQAHNLSIVCSNVLPFGNSALNITSIAKMDSEFSMTVDDLAKMLTEDLLESNSFGTSFI